ncbi:uncharacterized protein Z518_06709 [Rhinocladiella mackenziei CBS 650.93]|uniref:DUF3500 domain-containing protein n=1 Tax=Rhinocladiella mackenziei CBS 650.93 TaxID=1442369 RepID=A0A0D2GY69_9EURO|nr:uncharacterized protein Z518_06709 [Rhinocladiella mackenziei CBS 650.93]KIX03158.1 hypothetical protein Z518_06709 [Rhinocladiella mackenziei CBS 650.93]
MTKGHFRDHLPDLSLPRFTTMAKQNAHEYAQNFKESGQPPWLFALYQFWLELAKEPLKGVTENGSIRPDLYRLEEEGVPIDDIVGAATTLLDHLSDQNRRVVSYHIDAPEWRTWSNPEFLLSHKGLRLDEVTPQIRDDILLILRQTLSPEGYAKALGAMRINHFLGELVGAPGVMNEYSYNFAFFGTPSSVLPWGYTFYGHHLCLNIFLYRSQIVIAPWFTGAEPNYIDQGPYQGTRILQDEERLGLQLMQSLPKPLQAKAQTYKQLRDPRMPHGRWNHDDQRHLCGAYRDNRVVPYEGILVSEMDPGQVSLVLAILEQYLLYLPEKSRQIRLNDVKNFLSETYFSWIGGFTDTDPFYYRIQSPVILVEFDHHSGVFLDNREPAKFHIHTLLRMPNAGDYGHALRKLIPGMRQEWVWSDDLTTSS